MRLTRSHLIDEAVLQLVDGVEFACQLGEFVVGLGQLAFLDRLDGDGDLGLLAGVLAGGQRGGEDLGLAGRQPDDRVVETLDELARADLVGQALGRGLGHVLAVDGGGQVDRDEVAVLRPAARRRSACRSGRAAFCSSASTSSSVTSMGSTVIFSASRSGSLISGRTSTSAVNVEVLAVLDLGDLDLGLTERAAPRRSSTASL